jgi:hypothetical protein
MGCFLGILFGIFSISFTLPNFKSIQDGKCAGYQAH